MELIHNIALKIIVGIIGVIVYDYKAQPVLDCLLFVGLLFVACCCCCCCC